MTQQSEKRPFLGENPRRTLTWSGLILLTVAGIGVAAFLLIPGYDRHVRTGLADLTGRNYTEVPNGFRGRIIVRDDTRYLWGGRDPEQDFDISTFRLNPNHLQYGLGRERFAALIEPEFVSVDQADQWLWPEARVLLVQSGDETRVYPLMLMRTHEVVNDEINGEPIFAAYCLLADLGAVYDRRIGGEVLTFAVSGYTYGEQDVWDGMQAFVLWDRDTESLWWPPIGKAVSGPLVDVPMKLYDQSKWSQTTWAHVRDNHPDAKVLKPEQEFQRPTEWRTLDVSTLNINRVNDEQPAPDQAVAPRWGGNASDGRHGDPAAGTTTRPTTRPTTQPATTRPGR